MDVSNINVKGEWLELEIATKGYDNLKVLVVPRRFSGLYKMMMQNDMIAYLSEVVIDWNLKAEGKKVECTKENRMEWFHAIADWKIKNPRYAEKGALSESIGAEIIAFAGNIENFTKNSKPISN